MKKALFLLVTAFSVGVFAANGFIEGTTQDGQAIKMKLVTNAAVDIISAYKGKVDAKMKFQVSLKGNGDACEFEKTFAQKSNLFSQILSVVAETEIPGSICHYATADAKGGACTMMFCGVVNTIRTNCVCTDGALSKSDVTEKELKNTPPTSLK